MDKQKIQKVYPLTPMQEGMLYHAMLDPDSSSYFTQLELRISGSFDRGILQQSMDQLVRHYDILRTVFVYQQLQRPRQVVLAERKAEVYFADLADVGPEEQGRAIARHKRELQAQGFDLAKDQLFRVSLFQLAADRFHLIWSNHHILMDGWSMGVLMKRLFQYYEAIRMNRPLTGAQDKPYADYVKWLEKQDKDEALAYWDKRLADFEKPTAVPHGKPAAGRQDAYRNEIYEFVWDKSLVGSLKEIANRYHVTPPNLLQAMWAALLGKYNNSNDVVFGTVVSGRPPAIHGIEDMAGLFINTIPVRVKADLKSTFADLAKAVQRDAIEAEPFDYVPLYDIQKRSVLKNHLVGHLLAFENYPLDRELQNGGMEQRLGFSIEVANAFEQTNYDFNLIVYPGEDWSLKMMYNASLYDEAWIGAIAGHLTRIAEEVARDPEIEVGKARLLTEREQAEWLNAVNDTKRDYPRERTITELFEEQVRLSPEQPAIVFGERQMTYRELNAAAGRLARTLRERGLKPNEAAGIMAERSIEAVAGVLAILKAGGAYVPVDPEYPEERIRYLIEDSGMKMMLVQLRVSGASKASHNPAGVELIPVELEDPAGGIGAMGEPGAKNGETEVNAIADANDDANAGTNAADAANLPPVNQAGDLAYIIYTSGSTGQPKGVMVEHRNVVRLVQNAGFIPFGAQDRMAQTGAISFDASTFELFGALLNGGTLYPVPKEILLDAAGFAGFLRERQIGTLWLTSPLFNQLAGQNAAMFAGVRHLIIGGDALVPGFVNQVRAACPGLSLWNGYGPTENTTFSTVLPIAETYAERIPIGKPIGNSTAYIVDSEGQLLPIGVPGELCVGGDGVARGYLNRPELTKEKFVPNPFAPGEKMYRTGDLARWLPDGIIEFLGRIDHQVKVRGFRIELGEIESRLLQVEGVSEAVVIVCQDQAGENHLYAYFTAEREFAAGELRAVLAKLLPDYMLPSAFMQLEQMPLTVNGKVDRRALPEPGRLGEEAAVFYAEPENEPERQLAAIWQEVLGLSKVGATDDFFALGGHSLKAMMLTAKIKQQMGRDIPIKVLFDRPTIRGLAGYFAEKQAAGQADAGTDAGAEADLAAAGDGHDTAMTVPKRPSATGALDPIVSAPAGSSYPVSSSQRRMYILNQLGEGDTSYNIPAVLLLEGELDQTRLEAALQAMIDRHETLRTSFTMEGGELVQQIHEHVAFRLTCTQAAEAEAETRIREFIRPFDLSRAPLVRAELLRLEDQRYLLMIDMHHIVSDGSSTGILIRDLAQLYAGADLPAPNLHYKDFAAWQQAPAQREYLNRLERYWLDTFDGELPVLDLPTDYARPAVQSHAGDRFVFGVDEELEQRIHRLTAQTDTTLYMFLLAALNVLLSKYAAQEDIVVGSPVAGRTFAEIQDVPGMFVNTLPLRNAPEGGKTFEQFLRDVKETSLQAFDHQNYPLEELVEKLPLDRDLSRNPLFSVSLNMLNMEVPALKLGSLRISSYSIMHRTAKFDLTLEAVQKPAGQGGIGLSFDYATDLFMPETIRRYSGHLLQIIKAAVERPEIRLEEIELMTAPEREHMLAEQRDNRTDYPAKQPFHRLFEQRALAANEAVAVADETASLTYRELNYKANRAAWALIRRGVKAGDIVGLLLDRSVDMVVAILAVMKAGGAFLPIDPDFPEQRIRYCLKDSGARVILTETAYAGRWSGGIDAEMLDMKDESWFSEQIRTPDLEIGPDHAAYLIYTSGTTGNPKGVKLKHRGLVNYACWFLKEAELTPADKTSLLSSYAFDLGYTSLFPILLAGGELHIASKETYTDPERLIAYLGRQGTTYIKLTPSLFHMIVNASSFEDLRQLDSLRLIVLGGEKINPTDLASYHRKYPQAALMNHYGPTESTIGIIARRIDTERLAEFASRPTIGRPIHNAAAYVLDRSRRLVPAGVAGELYLAGPGLAEGYLNRADLTDEKFIANPYLPGTMMYRSGDLARLLPDGQVEFLGRADDQVKIRGYRVELGEIEAVLRKHEQVGQTYVTTVAEGGRPPELCVYFTAGQLLAASELRTWLSGRLPMYMVPTYFIQLDEIPLTGNGKINRRALPAPTPARPEGSGYAPPQNDAEAELCRMWRETLGVESVGVLDNYFDLGGHSLKAMQLISRIHAKWKRDVPLKAVFDHPTVRELAAYIEAAEQDGRLFAGTGIEPAAKREHYPVSSAQQRMYVLHQFNPGVSYNMPSVLLLEGELDAPRLERALNSLVERHETLRTSFREIDGEPVQIVHEVVRVELNVTDMDEEEAQRNIGGFIRPFDLSAAPLLRTGLIRLSGQRHLLLIDMHHIIADGISREIFVKEIARLYRGETLPAPRLSYKDYALWQQEPAQRKRISVQEKYWLDQFHGEIPTLHLPTDYPRPAVQSFAGGAVRFALSPETAQQLRRFIAETGTTFHMVMLAAFNVFLGKLTGQDDIVVGSVVAGRTNPDVKDMTGMFVNTLALRNRPVASQSFRQFVAEVKETALQGLAHQDYPFEDLVAQLDLPRDLSRNPLFNVMLTVDRPDKETFRLDRLTISPYEAAIGVAKFDLTLGAFEQAEGTWLQLEYASDLFKESTILRWSEYMQELLKVVASRPDLVLSAVEMVPPAEKLRTLLYWNETELNVPEDVTIHQLFERQVQRTPERPAVTY
ncbi:amino acid adenylation domain-containing protein, partial [Paenibacillus macerans]|uniref:amino acid adenylation domain-containing protein n=1 Tax=Paenibacillus macerans TaxID=44252 RepID=UPI003D317A38